MGRDESKGGDEGVIFGSERNIVNSNKKNPKKLLNQANKHRSKENATFFERPNQRQRAAEVQISKTHRKTTGHSKTNALD